MSQFVQKIHLGNRPPCRQSDLRSGVQYLTNLKTLNNLSGAFSIYELGDRYLIVNAENGNEIARLYSSSVGQFKHANGRLIVFKNDNRMGVHEVGCSGVTEISSRYA